MDNDTAWTNDLTLEDDGQGNWEVWDRQRSDIAAVFSQDYYSKDAAWEQVRALAKRINTSRPYSKDIAR